MLKADRVLSTPPTNTPIDATRRGFLAGTAVALAAGTAVNVAALVTIRPATAAVPATISIAAPAGLLDSSKASPAFRDAVRALADSPDALEAAKARFTEADRKAWAWKDDHPEPAGKRARKRWSRKFCDYREATHMDEWHAQLDAEKDFKQKQYAVAEYRPTDLNELGLMAAAAVVYDKTRLTYGQTAVISFGVVLAYFRLCVPPCA